MTLPSHSYTLDAALQLKDAGLVATTAAGTVGGDAAVYDTHGAYFGGRALLNVTAIEVASDNELYDVRIEGSDDESFATGVYVLASKRMGALEVTGESADTVTGMHVVPFSNAVVTTNGVTTVRYLRERTVVSGTVATGINFTCHLVTQD